MEHSDCGSGKARAWKQNLSHFFRQREDGYCQHSGYGHDATYLQCEGWSRTDRSVFTFYFTTFFRHVQATRERWECPSCSTARLLALSTVTWPPEVRKSSGEVVPLSSWQPPRPSSHDGIWLQVGRVLTGWFQEKLAVAEAVEGMLRLWLKSIAHKN